MMRTDDYLDEDDEVEKINGHGDREGDMEMERRDLSGKLRLWGENKLRDLSCK